MNQLQVFKNNEFGQVRTLTIENEPWFVGKDVANSLQYNESHKAVVRHVDEDDRMKHPIIDSLGRMQETIIINESGLYSLILSSKLPSAKKFKRWVTSEVLPSIRKNGHYTTNQKIILRPLTTDDYKEAAQMVVNCRRDKERLQIVLNLLRQGGYKVPELISNSKQLDANYQFLSNKLKRLLIQQGLSQNEFSKISGLPKSSVSYYVRGIHKPQEKTLMVICETLNIQPDYLFEEGEIHG